MKNKLKHLFSAKYLFLLPLVVIFFACEKKIDDNKEVLDSKNALTSFVFNFLGKDFDVSLDTKAKTGNVIIPYNTEADLSKLKVKSVSFSPLATCSVKAGDIINLSSTSKTFKVITTAQNSTRATYIITVVNSSNALATLELALSDKDSFEVSLDEKTKTGNVGIPYNTDDDLKTLKIKSVSFPISASCSVKAGDPIKLDSNKTFKVTVTSQNGSKTTHTITVDNSSNTLNSLVLTLSGKDFDVSLNDETKKGKIAIPFDTDLSKLKVKSLKFSTSATCSIKVDDIIDLTLDKSFKVTVTAQNGKEVIYTINGINSNNSFLSFEFLQSADNRLKEDSTFDIDGTNISGSVTYLESNNLKPVFSVSPGVRVEVNGIEQTSGVSTQDFTSPVTYTVIPKKTGETPKTYSVSVNFNYDKLSVSADGVLDRKNHSEILTGKLVLADKMNGHIVKSIMGLAFYKCVDLTGDLTIPKTVTSIETGAFAGCTGFTGTLTLPNTLKTIGQHAFRECLFTGSLTIPDSVTSIEDSVFYKCSGFTGTLTLPNTLKTIGQHAFRECLFTGSLTIPDSVTSIRKSAFNGCSGFTGTLTLPNSLKVIEDFVFYNCSGFTGVLTIPKTVTSIGKAAFYKCSGFTGDLTIPDLVTIIVDFSFGYCSGFNGTLTIPGSVTSIEVGAFAGCTGFTGNLTIPNSVTSIRGVAFAGCTGFTGDLTIPNSVTSIGGKDNDGTGGGAFEACTGFTGTLTIPNSVTDIGWSAFEGCINFTKICNKSTATPGTDAFKGVTTNTAGCP